MPTPSTAPNPSEELHITDLIGNAPNWLLRSGTTTLFAVVLFFTALTAFIRYPDKVAGEGIITTEIPPVELVTLEEGRIAQLFVQQSDTVQQHEPILFIANSASLTEVNTLRRLLQALSDSTHRETIASLHLPSLEQLGMMQANYAQLQQQCAAFAQLATEARVLAIEQEARAAEIQHITRLNQSLQRGQEIFEQELALKAKEHERQQHLHQQEIISAQAYEQQRGSYLQVARQYEGVETGIIQNWIRMNQLQTEGARKQANHQLQAAAAATDITHTVALLNAQLHVWEQRYFIKAEAAGIVAFASNMEERTFLPAGSLVGHIIPLAPGSMVANIRVPVQRSGTLEQGQTVLLKAPAYPYKDFGMLSARLDELSPIALQQPDGQQYYELRCQLPDTLRSTYGKHLAYRPNMHVSAEVVSENKSLFERIFNQFFNLLQNQ